jgi:ribosome-associated protein
VTDGLEIRPGLVLPLTEVELRTSRSSGPGGQHANVTASRVEAVFDVHALERLAQRLNTALETRRPRRPTRPTAASKRRRVDAKRRRSETKRARRRPEPD